MNKIQDKKLKLAFALIVAALVIAGGFVFLMDRDFVHSVRDGFGGDDALPKNVTIAPSLFDGIKLPPEQKELPALKKGKVYELPPFNGANSDEINKTYRAMSREIHGTRMALFKIARHKVRKAREDGTLTETNVSKLPAREFLDSGDNAVILTGIKVLEKKLETLNKEYAALITKHKKFKPAML